MDRRVFISQMSLALAACSTSNHVLKHGKKMTPSVQLSSDNPYAIAMWDFSWLLRRYPEGGFESWDKALSELIERGYNAIRIDCFPQFIGKDDDGISESVYSLPKQNSSFILWGNDRSIQISPKEDLLLFLQKCKERDIGIVLSSWFNAHGTKRNSQFSGADGLIRAWDNTLQFLHDHDALHNILYIDILNEYPLWHGYDWLTNQLHALSPKSQMPFDFLNSSGQRQYSSEQITFYNEFILQVLQHLKSQWPQLKFMTSQTNTLNTPWQDLDLTQHDVLDIHLWMVYNQSFSKETEYFKHIHTLKNDHGFKRCVQRIDSYWSNHQTELTNWMKSSIKERAIVAKKYNVPLGCTEGWGAVMWMDHPDLSWNFIKQSGLLSAKLGAEYGYSFNCSSNFTHPHFKGLWNDISWHQEVTKTIRKL